MLVLTVLRPSPITATFILFDGEVDFRRADDTIWGTVNAPVAAMPAFFMNSLLLVSFEYYFLSCPLKIIHVPDYALEVISVLLMLIHKKC